jgi:uncharacterized protein YigE (DUF2233 family)
VFAVRNGTASIIESQEYQQVSQGQIPTLAVQSGPLLLHHGTVHPAFKATSENRKLRSAVGVRDGGEVVFVLSESPMTFYELATLFRDRLGCADALYLDGEISKLYAPRFGWADGSGDFAGIFAVTEPDR